MGMIKIRSNLDGLAAIIGTYQGIAEGAEDERFIQQLLVAANKRTLEKFNVKAGERSRRTRNLNRNFNHMYEYGTAGITPGAVVNSDPASPEARLWVFKTAVSGRSVNTFLTYRDAVIPNPLPSERPDLKGVSNEIISKMSTRKYVFRRRAEMVEEGRDVNISPYRAQALIFPSRENESGVGFWHKSMGPMKNNLGGETSHGRSKHKGAFTNYFLAWWEAEGQSMVTVSAHNSFAARIGAAQRAAKKVAPIKPIRSTNTKVAAAKAAAEAKRIMLTKGVGE